MNEENLIYDGEIHIIDEKRCYILKKISASIYAEEMERLKKEYQEDFTLKYCKYLVKNDPNEASEILAIIMLGKDIRLKREDFFEFIYRPPEFVSVLYQYATFAMIFNRIPNDGL